jgi:transcriptional regulator with XRE-family HTH domain
MAFTNPQHGTGEEAKRLRKEAGAMLKAMREAVEKTQRDLANEVGFDYYTMVSQIENGKTRVPPAQVVSYAKALRIPPRDLAKKLMRYYDPLMFEILFTNKFGK